MKVLYCLCILSLVFSTIKKDENVLVLDDTNFDEALKEYEILLVEFYAPWCGHCKKLAPEYSAAAKVLGDLEEPLYLAKVDATANPRLTKEYGIRGFPTLKFFRNGIGSDYDYGRTKEEIIDFMQSKSGPLSVTFFSSAELKEKLNAEPTTIVGYFESTESKEYKEWYAIISSLDEVNAVHITSDTVAEEMGVEIPSIYIYDDASTKIEFTGDIRDMKKWLILNSLPLIVPFSQTYSKKLFSSEHDVRTQLIVFAPEKELGDTSSVLEKVARTFHGKLFVVHIPSQNGRLLEYFGISSKEVPALLIANFESNHMKKYRFEGDITDDAVNQFIIQYFGGLLAPYYKSEEVPKQVDLVYRVVGKTFDEIVNDSRKNVLVLFYAPWCGHCKALMPVYKELGDLYSDDDNVMIAQMDATANEVEGVVIRGFPTIKFYKAGEDKRGIDYEGERTVEGMKEFIEKNRVFVSEEDEL